MIRLTILMRSLLFVTREVGGSRILDDPSTVGLFSCLVCTVICGTVYRSSGHSDCFYFNLPLVSGETPRRQWCCLSYSSVLSLSGLCSLRVRTFYSTRVWNVSLLGPHFRRTSTYSSGSYCLPFSVFLLYSRPSSLVSRALVSGFVYGGTCWPTSSFFSLCLLPPHLSVLSHSSVPIRHLQLGRTSSDPVPVPKE